MKLNSQLNGYFENYVKDKKHANHVMNLSLELFDKINNIINLFDEEDRELLQCGALLHDIGYSFADKSHNKAGRDFILNNNIIDFSLSQNIIIANIIRYHRGKLPKSTHSLFINLDEGCQRKTAILSGICRLADGLDSNHLGVVEHLDFFDNDDIFFLKIYSKNPNAKKIINTKGKKDLLELYLGKKIKILCSC